MKFVILSVLYIVYIVIYLRYFVNIYSLSLTHQSSRLFEQPVGDVSLQVFSVRVSM